MRHNKFLEHNLTLLDTGTKNDHYIWLVKGKSKVRKINWKPEGIKKNEKVLKKLIICSLQHCNNVSAENKNEILQLKLVFRRHKFPQVD